MSTRVRSSEIPILGFGALHPNPNLRVQSYSFPIVLTWEASGTTSLGPLHSVVFGFRERQLMGNGPCPLGNTCYV
jgi:hypothetical protein